MALTITTNKGTGNIYTLNAQAADNVKIITGSWAFPSTYADGGISVNLAQFGLNNVFFADFKHDQLHVNYDYTTSMLLCFYCSVTETITFYQTPSDTAVSTSAGYFIAIGT